MTDLHSLRGAYRDWLREAHPDRGGDPRAFVVGLAEWRRQLDAGAAAPLVFHRRRRSPLARWIAWRSARRRPPRVR